MVEYANIFFTSDWNAALTPPYAAVQEPTTTNKYLLKTEYSNKWLKRRTKKTPAETKRTIESYFGTFDDMVMTSVSLQNNNTQFADSTTSEKRKEFEKLLRIDIFEKLIEQAV